jgi:hypothetical protein
MPVAGDKIRASHVTDLFARKTATESVTSSTTLQDDDELFVTVEANSVYTVEALILYDGATTGDFKFNFDGPAGATFTFSAMLPPTSATSATAPGTTNFSQFDDTQTLALGAVGAGTPLAIPITGILIVGGTAGTFKLTWAQQASDVTATRVFAPSFIRARKVT